jgi:1-aminocyclopropane-1-carboxylate deaminase
LVPYSETEYSYAGNIQLNHILGAEVFPVDSTEEEVIEVLRSRGKQPYLIPSGASLHPLGGLGYARAAFEVLEQEKQLDVTFDTIVTAVGSGSTLGGLVAGFKLAENRGFLSQKKRLLGFSIGHRKTDMTEIVLRIARTAATKIGVRAEDITEDDFEINDEFLGDAYGVLNTRTMDGIKELARTEGILTDPVYTGKAFTGLLSMAKSGKLATGNVLFLHTGGQVAMSAYPQLK